MHSIIFFTNHDLLFCCIVFARPLPVSWSGLPQGRHERDRLQAPPAQPGKGPGRAVRVQGELGEAAGCEIPHLQRPQQRIPEVILPVPPPIPNTWVFSQDILDATFRVWKIICSSRFRFSSFWLVPGFPLKNKNSLQYVQKFPAMKRFQTRFISVCFFLQKYVEDGNFLFDGCPIFFGADFLRTTERRCKWPTTGKRSNRF